MFYLTRSFAKSFICSCLVSLDISALSPFFFLQMKNAATNIATRTIRTTDITTGTVGSDLILEIYQFLY